MTSKKCTKCGLLKPLTEFHKCKQHNDGYRYDCHSCSNIYVNKYRKTKKGLTKVFYQGQLTSSKHRNHDLPKYSLHELREWLYSQPNFNNLFIKWVESGYKKMLKPSCDRLDDYKPYTFDNLRLVTWQENFDKGHADRVNGINNKMSKKVSQLTLLGKHLNSFYSLAEAGRSTNIAYQSISACCKGKLQTAGGYKWEYVL